MINSTTSTDRAAHVDPVAVPGQAIVRPLTPRPDQLSTDSAVHLRGALNRQPEIRPEVVERARALVNDPEYPSPATLKAVGRMILNSPDLSEDQS